MGHVHGIKDMHAFLCKIGIATLLPESSETEVFKYGANLVAPSRLFGMDVLCVVCCKSKQQRGQSTVGAQM